MKRYLVLLVLVGCVPKAVAKITPAPDDCYPGQVVSAAQYMNDYKDHCYINGYVWQEQSNGIWKLVAK